MRFLANENVPGPLVQALADAGCDVAWARTIMRGAPDGDVLALAAREDRVLITFDKDFGEIARGADWAGVVRRRAVPHAYARVAR